MRIVRTLVLTGLVLLTALSLAPAASAGPDNVYVCVTRVAGGCGNDQAFEVHAKNHEAGACVIGIEGSCDPYQGHLVRAHVDGREVVVPDPCYTTACF
jgi:hypothetical protein